MQILNHHTLFGTVDKHKHGYNMDIMQGIIKIYPLYYKQTEFYVFTFSLRL